MTGRALIQVTGTQVLKRKGKRIVKVASEFADFARHHQSLLRRALRNPNEEVDFRQGVPPRRLEALGFTLDTSVGGYVFPFGDEAGERVLLGIDAPPPRLEERPLTPPVVVIEAEEDVPVNSDGRNLRPRE